MRKNRTWIMVVGALALGSAATFMVTRSLAAGIPATGTLTYTGVLLNPDGTSVSGSKSIGIVVYDAQTAGNQICNVPSASITLTGGRFQVALPDACRTGVNAHADLWVEVAVDGTLLGRTKLGAVPYAVEASHADKATQAESMTTATDQSVDAQWMLLHAAAAGACSANAAFDTGANGGAVVPKSTSTCDQTCAALTGATYTCQAAVAVSNISTTRISAANTGVAQYYKYGCGSPYSSGESSTATPSVSGLYVYCCCMS